MRRRFIFGITPADINVWGGGGSKTLIAFKSGTYLEPPNSSFLNAVSAIE